MRRLVAAVMIVSAVLSTRVEDAASAVPVSCSAGYVNLGFDDSPTPLTPSLLTKLKDNGLKATFFDVGERLVQYPTYARNQVNGGHQIANHTQLHADLTGALSPISDLVKTEYLLIQQTGVIPTFYRPPYGVTNPDVRSKALELGLTEVIWTVDTVDWSGASSAAIAATAATVNPGGFILMHDGYASTVEAIPTVASMLKARGLCAGKIVTSTLATQAWQGLSFNATAAKF